jgi:transposase-like protein
MTELADDLTQLTTAVEMAREVGITAHTFRVWLRWAGLPWHEYYYKRWTVVVGSPEHEDMLTVRHQVVEKQGVYRIVAFWREKYPLR